MAQPTVAVAMIAKNEEKNLARSLPSVQFADEIVVVENDSTDRTVEVAKTHNAHVFSQPWRGYAAQRNFSIEQTHADWVLILDADEVVTPELATEIKAAIAGDDVDGYWMATQTFIGGRAIRHGGWSPDYHLRLVRHEKARYVGTIHETVPAVSRTATLKNPLLHYPYASIQQWLEKVGRYTDLEAQDKPFSLLRLIFKPPATFIRSYIFWSGWLDGTLGLKASLIGAWYKFLVEVKRWRRRHLKVNP